MPETTRTARTVVPDARRPRSRRRAAGRGRVVPRLAGAVCLALGLGGAAIPEAFAGAQDAARDAQLAVRVKTALVNDVDLGTMPIDVAVRGGAVTLRGVVGSAADVDRAVALARGVDGVASVRAELDVVAGGPPPRERPRTTLPALAPPPSDDPLRLIGVGVSGTAMLPARGALDRSIGVGAVLRLRPRAGVAPVFAFSWRRTRFAEGSGVSTGTGLSVRPVMGGVEYRVGDGRVSAAASLVAGYAFNRLRVDREHAGPAWAVEVKNSFVWRAGGSVWVDVTPRFGVNAFGGYLVTRPEVALLSGGSVVNRQLNADTAIVSLGVAWWIF